MLRPELDHLSGIDRTRIVMPDNVTMRVGRLEKPEPWPTELVEAIRESLPLDKIQQYPAYQPFYERLAEFIGVSDDQIVVGAGIEEFIRTLMAGCFGRKMAALWPTCAMIDVYARSFQVALNRIVTDPFAPPTILDVVEHIDPDTSLVMLANPGQPVGTCYDAHDIRWLATYCREIGATLAVDEAYFGFGAPTAVRLVGECDNLIVLRTFSKAFGAAGLRLGYAVAQPKLKRAVDAVRQSGEVSALSMHVATVLMDRYDEFVVPSINEICAARDWLTAQFTADGMRAWGSVANHVLVHVGPDMARKAQALAAEGVLVRHSMPAPLHECLMVTCGSMQLMRQFYERFRAA
jgi:histidinol-phosphate aminotransferase